MHTHDCHDCALTGRREFLRDIGWWLGAALVAPLPVRFGRAIDARGTDRTYPIPDSDGATIDRDNQVILVRFEGKAYAFALSCPHQNTALRWHPEDGQFQCPKHHSRYRPDGVFISGRATRSMDRFALRLEGRNVVVDLDKLFRQDQDAADWDAAVVAV
jgi:nitrite reductase/ring-hydroxylating ferredoxin subunit